MTTQAIDQTLSRRTAVVLGIDGTIRSPRALAKLVGQGLPGSAVRAVAGRIFEAPADRRALMRRLAPAAHGRRKGLLSPGTSERIGRLARVIATAEYVWNDREGAREFLVKPHPMLGGRRPVDVALGAIGARKVEEVLRKLFYGLAA